jgi:hypothetical protein
MATTMQHNPLHRLVALLAQMEAERLVREEIPRTRYPGSDETALSPAVDAEFTVTKPKAIDTIGGLCEYRK